MRRSPCGGASRRFSSTWPAIRPNSERGLVRALLTLQARWERINVERAERVIVPSRYSAGVAQDVYAIPGERVAVVPEPIDVAEWRRPFPAGPPPIPRPPPGVSGGR